MHCKIFHFFFFFFVGVWGYNSRTKFSPGFWQINDREAMGLRTVVTEEEAMARGGLLVKVDKETGL